MLWSESVGVTLISRDLTLMKIKVPSGQVHNFIILQTFPFTSETKRMGIILRVRTPFACNMFSSSNVVIPLKKLFFQIMLPTCITKKIHSTMRHWQTFSYKVALLQKNYFNYWNQYRNLGSLFGASGFRQYVFINTCKFNKTKKSEKTNIDIVYRISSK